MGTNDIVGYTTLVKRYSELLLHMGADWTPEVDQELEEVRKKISLFKK